MKKIKYEQGPISESFFDKMNKLEEEKKIKKQKEIKKIEKILTKLITMFFVLFLTSITFLNIYVFSYIHAQYLIEGFTNEILNLLLIGNALLFSVLSYWYWKN